MKPSIRLYFFLLLLFGASLTSAAQCDCDFIISLSATEYQFDGVKKGVKPGDKICFASGTRTGIQLLNIKGTPENPVIITNMCDGQVTINAPSTWGNVLSVEGCSNFILHGQGNPSIEYGFKLTGGQAGLNLQKLSTNFEVHHMDIDQVGCSGILVKTDPTCDSKTWRGNFELRNAHVHHNKVNRTGCEGFYVGNSHYDNVVTKTCNGVATVVQEHNLFDVEIAYNTVTNTDLDGIQVGGVNSGGKIHHNYIENVGIANDLNHRFLLQIGGGTSGALAYNNYCKDGRSWGIIDGGGGNYIFNNIVINTPEGGILLLDDVNPGPMGGRIFNNTLINCKKIGFKTFNQNGLQVPYDEKRVTRFINNIIVGQNYSPYTYIGYNFQPNNPLIESNNIKTQDINTVKFVNPTALDFRLQPSSPAVDAGFDATVYGITFDFDEMPRPGGGKFDLGAFELQSTKPTANAGVDQTITLPTNSVTLPGTASSKTGITSYSWTKKSGGAATITNGSTATASVTDLVEGVYVFQFQVVDANGTATDEVTVTVLPEPPNQNPTASAGTDQNVVLPTSTTTITGAGTDPDGTIASYAWTQTSGPSPATLTNETTAVLSLADLIEGSYTFQLTVTDNDGATNSDVVTINVLASGSQPPTVNIADATITIFTPANDVTVTATAADPDGTISTILWEKKSGATATLTNTNTLTFTADALVLGTYVFRITVTDNTGLQAFDEVTVQVLQGNQAPTAAAGGDKSITLPTNTTVITGSGTDSDGSIASYLWVQVSGPACTLANAGTNAVTVNNMVQGTYVFGLTVTDDDGATGYDEVKVVVNSAPPNVAPIVSAGSDRTISLPQSTLSLTGTASDSDGTISTRLWTKKNGPTATLTNANTLTLSLSNLVAGTYTFTLTVTDDDGASKADDVVVTVLPETVNQAPVANAGANVFLTLPSNSTTINGIGSDNDGTIASYVWTKVSGPTATVSGASTANLQLSALVAGTYIYQLTVTDDDGATASDEVSIFVSVTNLLPTVVAGENITVILPTSSAQLNATANDKDGSIALYQWTTQSGPSAPTLGATEDIEVTGLVQGTYVFRLTVTDNSSATAFDEVTVTVIAATANQLPVVNVGNDREIFLPTNSAVISGTATDADGTIVSYLWTQQSGTAALLSNTTTNTLTALNLVEGTAVFRLTVTDNDGGSTFDDVKVVVNPSTSNQSPVANAGSNKILQLPTSAINLAGSGFDPDGSIASYSWTKVSGGQATLTNQTSATLKLTNLLEGSYTFRLTVMDNLGATGTSDVSVTVLPLSVNQSPLASAGQNQVITLPQNTASLAGSGFDPDGSIASYQWTKASGPAGGTLSTPASQITSITGLLEGVYVYNLTVTDNAGATGTDAITVTVLNAAANKTPIANAGGNQTITLPTSSLNLFGNGFDSDGSITAYQWTKLTGGTATLTNATTKTLSLTNLQAGKYSFRLRVTDNQGATGDDVATIVVNGQATNVSPVAFAGADKLIKLPTTSVSLAGSGSDIDGQIVAYSWTQVSGATVKLGGTNTSSLSVSNLALGFYKFRLTVTDNVQASSFDEVTVQVVSATTNLIPVINLGADKNIILPTNQLTINATVTDDGTIGTYLWTKVSGPSVTISNPAVEDVQLQNLVEGTYTFQLTVADNAGASASKTVKVIVSPFVNSPPVVDVGDDIEITLPDNQTTFTGTITEPDGTAYTLLWSRVSGPVPTESDLTQPGLTLTNLVAGTYVYKLLATDPNGATGSDLITLVVNPVPPNQPPTVSAGENQFLELPVSSTNLSGTAVDPESDPVTVEWTQTKGPNTATLATPNNLTTTVSNLVEGSYTFRLTATDNLTNSNFSEVVITIVPPDPPDDKFPPLAFAGDDVILFAPEDSVSLAGQGQAITIDAFIDSYVWEQIGGPSTTMIPNDNNLDVRNLVAGTYAFKLTVTDSDNLSSSDIVIVYYLEESDDIPKFFSPNNDGAGDVWTFRNAEKYSTCKLQVLSRTGQEVMTANPYQNDWNGLLSNGKTLPDGDYYYILSCEDGRQIKGAVRIIR